MTLLLELLPEEESTDAAITYATNARESIGSLSTR